eukprot:NODE_14885_length_1079_cov_8.158613.p1 GENE.NODE_14885_length_1079_cov_8.158613~~NODE_14885_length_1079_cov_8.158613.p1  ORF type:complete len:220 (-),score=51.35 NODE_14885_length_1079_cov_8.158613:326-985(-)
MAAPTPVRTVMLSLWLCTFGCGVAMLYNQFRGNPEGACTIYLNRGVPMFFASYFLDTVLSASPLRWLTMHGIPVHKVLQHHVPFLACAFACQALILMRYGEFEEAIVGAPMFLTYMASGFTASLNEAMWVLAGLLPPHWVEDRRWQKFKAAASVYGLADCIFLGGPSSFFTILRVLPRVLRGELLLAHAVILIPTLPMLFQVPFLQVPQLRSALRKLRR